MIPVSRPSIRRADMDAVLTRMANDSIGAGALSREFASAVAKYLDRRGGVAFRSQARAIEATLTALGLGAGARVGMSALVPAHVYRRVVARGMEPVLIDVQKHAPVLPSPLDFDYQALGLSALYVETRLGFVADLEHLNALGIALVEDVSEGLGGNTGRRPAGAYGDVTIVAVEPEHSITAGGGAVCVSNSTKRLSLLADPVELLLGELPMPDMNAALGLTQIKQIERFVERRQQIAARFVKALMRSAHRMPVSPGEGEHILSGFPVLVETSVTDVEAYARSHGVVVARALADSTLEYLRHNLNESQSGFETFMNALALSTKLVSFPLYPTLGASEIDRIERVLSTLP